MEKKVRCVLDYICMAVAFGLLFLGYREMYRAFLTLGSYEAVDHVFISVAWMLPAGVTLFLADFLGHTKEERKARRQRIRERRAEEFRRQFRY